MNEKLLVRVLKWGVIATFLMPLIVTGNSTIFPFVFSKGIYLRVLIEVLAILYIALAVRFPAYRPRRTIIFYLVWALMGASFLSSVFGVDFSHSMWGNYERMSGFFTIIHYAVLMTIAAAVFQTKEEWLPLWRAALVAGFIAGITGLNFLLPDDSIMKIGGGGTLGNLIYLANYVMFTVLIAWYVWKIEKNKLWRYAAAGFGIIGILIMMYNGKRGPFIGLVAGVVIGLLIYAFTSRNIQLKRWYAGALVILVVLGLGVYSARNTRIVESVSVLNDLTHTTLTGGTAETRFIAWGVALKAFKDHPVFGWGPENFYYAFNTYYNPLSLQHGYYETWFDRSHNIFLDYLSMTGAVGFLIYISIFAAIGYEAVRRFRARGLDLITFVFVVMFFAAFVSQSVFVFDHLSSLLLFFLLAAFADVVTRAPFAPEGASRSPTRGGLTLSQGSFIALAAVLLLWSIFQFNINEWSINNQTLLTGKLFNGQPTEALAIYTSLVHGSSTFQNDVTNNYAQEIIDFASNPKVAGTPEFKPFWQLAVDGLERTLSMHPLDITTVLKLAALQEAGGAYNPQSYQDANQYYARALELSPKRQQVIYSWVRLKGSHGDTDGALALLERARTDDPKIADSYWYEAIIYAQINKNDQALAQLREAFALGKSPANANEALFAARVLSQNGDLSASVQYYEQALQSQPNDGRLLLTLAEVYTKLGYQEKAKEMLDRAQLADPALVEKLKQDLSKQKK